MLFVMVVCVEGSGGQVLSFPRGASGGWNGFMINKGIRTLAFDLNDRGFVIKCWARIRDIKLQLHPL